QVLVLPLADDVRRRDAPGVHQGRIDLDPVVTVVQRLRARAEEAEGRLLVLAEEVGDRQSLDASPETEAAQVRLTGGAEVLVPGDQDAVAPQQLERAAGVRHVREV